MSLPPAAIALGAAVNGINTDPCTYLVLQLASRYSESEDERSMILGTSLADFRREGRHESIDNLLTRWDLARSDAASVGADIEIFHIPTTLLMRAIGMSTSEITQFLIPTNGLMPSNRQEYDAMLRRIRMMGRRKLLSPIHLLLIG